MAATPFRCMPRSIVTCSRSFSAKLCSLLASALWKLPRRTPLPREKGSSAWLSERAPKPFAENFSPHWLASRIGPPAMHSIFNPICACTKSCFAAPPRLAVRASPTRPRITRLSTAPLLCSIRPSWKKPGSPLAALSRISKKLPRPSRTTSCTRRGNSQPSFLRNRFRQHRGAVSQHFRHTLHHFRGIVAKSYYRIGAMLRGVQQQQLVRVFAGLFAQVSQNRDIASHDRLQSRAQVSDHASDLRVRKDPRRRSWEAISRF